MKYEIVVLFFLHLIFLSFSVFYLFKEIGKNKKISLISYFKIFYLIFFGISPLFVLLNFNNYDLKYYFTRSMSYYYLSYVVIVVFYLFFCFFSKIKIKGNKKSNNTIIIEENTTMFWINIIFSIIGLASLLLWTKAYGKPWDMIKYGSLVRSGYVILYNPYTFMKPFCKFSLISLLGLLFCKNNKYKLLSKVFILINLFSIVIYSLASDSRSFMVTCLLVFFSSKYNKDLQFNIKSFFKYFLFLIIILFFFSKINTITYYIKNHQLRNDIETNKISKVMIDNFAYTYRNVINVQYNILNDYYVTTSEFTDLKNIIFSWVPSKLKKDYVYTLPNRNTDFYVGFNASIPSDAISSGFYKFHYIGILIMPLLIATILKFLENRIGSINNSFGTIIYNTIGCLICQELVSNYDASVILFSSLFLIIYYFTIKIFCIKRINYVTKEEINL